MAVAQIENRKRVICRAATSAPVVTPGVNVQTKRRPHMSHKATLSLTVTPTINPLNDHVRLKIAFNDDFFLTADPNSDKIQSK